MIRLGRLKAEGRESLFLSGVVGAFETRESVEHSLHERAVHEGRECSLEGHRRRTADVRRLLLLSVKNRAAVVLRGSSLTTTWTAGDEYARCAEGRWLSAVKEVIQDKDRVGQVDEGITVGVEEALVGRVCEAGSGLAVEEVI